MDIRPVEICTVADESSLSSPEKQPQRLTLRAGNHIHDHCQVAASSGLSIVSKGGSQMTSYNEQESLHLEKCWVDGWVKQTQDFHTGDCCLCPV